MQTDNGVARGSLLVQLLPGLRINPLRNPALNFMQVWPLGRRDLDNRGLLQCQTVNLTKRVHSQQVLLRLSHHSAQ